MFLEQIRRPIPQNLVIADGVAVPLTGVAGIALNGVHSATLHLFYNTNMVGAAILYAVFVRPVEENDIAGVWCRPAVQPLAFILEPVYPVSADSELRQHRTKTGLRPLHTICLIFFRHLALILLVNREIVCARFVQANEKIYCATRAQSLCGVALTLPFAPEHR